MFFKVLFVFASANTIGILAQSTEDTSVASTTEAQETPSRVFLLDEYFRMTKKHNKQFDKNLDQFNKQLKELNEESTSFMESLFYKLLVAEQSQSDARIQRLQDQVQEGFEDLKEEIGKLGRNISETSKQVVVVQKVDTELGEKINTEQDESVKNQNPGDSDELPKDCLEVKKRGNGTSGVYWIQPNSEPFMVLCNMELRGGGWIVVQNRFDGSQNFSLGWKEYQQGFGNVSGEFWLGLDHLHELTGDGQSEVLFKLVDKNLEETYAHYATFGIGDETEVYNVKYLDKFDGDAGNSFIHHRGVNFSTPEHGQDCFTRYEGGWWFRPQPVPCIHVNLNGDYFVGGTSPGKGHGVHWYMVTREDSSLVASQMMVRRKKLVSK